MGSAKYGPARAGRQVADDGGFNVDFAVHKCSSDLENRGPSPILSKWPRLG